MGAIQNSINQLLGTTALSAGFINHQLGEQRKALEQNTDAAMGQYAQMARVRGGEGLAQSVEKAQESTVKNRAEYSNSIMGNIQAMNKERSKASMYRSMSNNLINTDHWRYEAQQRLEQEARHKSFVELVKNPNATAADVEQWRKQ